MRVGIYTECLLKKQTGIEHMTFSLVKGMSSRCEVICIHSSSKRHPRTGTRHRLFRPALRIPSYNLLASIFRTRCFDDLDILHLPHPSFPFLKRPKAKVVVTVHDLIPLIHPSMHNARRRFYFRYLLPGYLKKADAIIAVSESTRKDLMKILNIPSKKIHVVHNGIDLSQFRPSKTKQDYILYMGTLEPRKNIEGLLKAFAIIRHNGFDHKLIIAGKKGWDYKGIFRLIRKLKLENHVVYKGYSRGRERQELYRKAKMLVWPSFYEGFGLPPLEAMASGTPVVTSDVSSIPEVVGDAAILVNPDHPRDIARGIIEVLSSKERYEELVRKGLERSKLFSLNHMIDKTFDVYRTVVEK
ncbi:glycosyltransferase family 4 protein [Candidatus Woesearchaeota archaeon]|nr:glycosyltransferase family 4 protein [Candidatus Woesearchaeota archaeon]